MDYNAPGQRHASRYLRPKNEYTTLRDANGFWTGHLLHVSQLRYTAGEKKRAAAHGYHDIDGLCRIDYHERFGPVSIETGAKPHLVLHRGGEGYIDGSPPGSAVKYGGIALGDLDDDRYDLGSPVPAGDGRGAPANDKEGLYMIRCRPMPHLLYKGMQPSGIPWGSLWWTYSDLGTVWGGEVHYLPLLWSFLNTAGGGHVRAILSDGMRIRQCNVPRETCGVYSDETGDRIGDAEGQYVRTSSHCFGWVIWRFRTIYTGSDWIYCNARVG